MAKPHVFINSLTLHSGQRIELQDGEKILIVGANNSGKSQTLRDIEFLISAGPQRAQTKVIRELTLHKEGATDTFQKFLDDNAVRSGDYYMLGDWQLYYLHVSQWLAHPNWLPADISKGFIKNVDASQRLAICSLAPAPDINSPATMPQQIMYNDSAATRKISDLFKLAFGKEVFFNYRGGAHCPLHVGVPPDQNVMPDRASDEYVAAVRLQPLLHEQGDGIKAYAGILFATVVSPKSITLIDEPEAFLHPPQMRKLGATLAGKVDSQLIVATHSSDILRGFLEGAKGQARILRIDRSGDLNSIHEAPPEVVKQLWQQPVLRYSNALDAILHEQAIICEDDSDCRLYNAVEDHLHLAGDIESIDTAYVPAGGKSGIPSIALALRRIGVRTKAIFDLDLLSDGTFLKTTVESFGGDWNVIKDDYSRLASAVTSGIPPKSPEAIKEEIINICNTSDGLPKSSIRDALQQTSPWNLLKKSGEAALPRGDARTYFAAVTTYLESIGVYVVKVGEAENFCPRLGAHGPKFVTNLLETVNLDDPELASLREFAQAVIRKRA